MTKLFKIDPHGWYTMQDIVSNHLFPWIRSPWSVRNAVVVDSKSKKLLKPNITGSGRGTKYYFKGENIIKYVKNWEGGNARLK